MMEFICFFSKPNDIIKSMRAVLGGAALKVFPYVADKRF